MNYEFEKLHNFRDLGGLVGDEGRKVLPHRLLRSGNLAKLNEHDVSILQDTYHLRHVIDLRTHEWMFQGLIIWLWTFLQLMRKGRLQVVLINYRQ